ATFGRDSRGVSVTFVEKVVRGGDEIGKGVALVHETSGVVPGLAHVSAAADVSVGEDESTVEETEAVAAEGDGQRVAVGAVTVDEEGIFAALKLVFAIDEGDGDFDTIWRFGEEAFGGVEIFVEVAGDFDLLEESGFAGGNVVLEDGAGGDEGLIAVAVFCGVEDAVGVWVRGVDGFGEGDFLGFGRG